MLWRALVQTLAISGSVTAEHLVLQRQATVTSEIQPTVTFEFTIGQTLTSVANTTTESRALGGPTGTETLTETVTPVDWSAVLAVPTFTAPVPPPNPNDTTSSANISRRGIEPEDAHIEKRVLPRSVDWRNKDFGTNYLASIQNQGACGSCWAFAAAALVETQARIEHGVWSKRSEADVHDMHGASCAQSGNPASALNWIASQGLGITDPRCYEYYDDDRLYLPCSDKSGRSLRFGQVNHVSDAGDQKRWLAEIGPLIACFNVYEDFYNWRPGYNHESVYIYNGTANFSGSHCVLIIGYDDGTKGWLFRNSWGTGFGDAGYGWIGYGQVDIDRYAKIGIRNVDPDPWVKRKHHNGMMFESGYGTTHRNFQLVRANPANGHSITEMYRHGESPFAWVSGARLVQLNSFGKPIADQKVHGQPIMLENSINRDFELIYTSTGGNLYGWYYSNVAKNWYYKVGPSHGGIKGYPGFVQMDDSSHSLVVMAKDNSLVEYIRDGQTGFWVSQAVISPPYSIIQSGPSLVQSNVNLNLYDSGTHGNLYVVAVLWTGQLRLFNRETGPRGNLTWIPSEIFGSQVGSTPPVMIQDHWRTKDENDVGGFQLLVVVKGQVQHWQRLNMDIVQEPPHVLNSGRWKMIAHFGSNAKHVWSLVQGSFDHALEAVVEDTAGELWHWQYGSTGWVRVAKIPAP